MILDIILAIVFLVASGVHIWLGDVDWATLLLLFAILFRVEYLIDSCKKP